MSNNRDRDITAEIRRLKKEKDAVIVAHNYQNDDIQNIADEVGDSFYLSKYCAKSSARVIVFCGVRFMAESAKVLSPEKTVLLPELRAGCPMASGVSAQDVRNFKSGHPGAVTVCYINTTAEVKAECDVCCTSSNAVKIVKSVREKDVLFLPDKNLGSYVAKKVPEKNVIPYSGCCPTHNRFGLKELEAARESWPGAPVAVHPECRPEVVEHADFVGSTSEIIDYCRQAQAKRIIIGTEMGVLHKLRQDNPGKEFLLLTPRLICSNMKLTSLESVYHALNEEKHKIEVDESVRQRAVKSLNRMLELG